ncbi:DUF2264 domain-containing protein [Embleya scabrispora]|uniref:DUF2264 domain-containing protein n=1 Tax=Embleya scabrispora TaxID=159449 RepID=UPI000372A528|nr:DUF2264 domain-containing protein [Embleya scabrispora]
MNTPHPFVLPPEDRTLSPYTGWTRAHWEAVADGLLTAVRPYRSPGGALITLPGRTSWSGERSDGLEGYARTFLLAALRAAGTAASGRPVPAALLEPYADGLRAGTAAPGTADAESWPAVVDRGQAMVEAASVALALHLTKDQLWDRLDESVRERAADWLAGALRHEPVDNNWWLFPVAVGTFLEAADRHTGQARAAIDRGLARIEKWYVGDGWYTDGAGRYFDHYNGWAMHLYPLLCAAVAGEPTDPVRRERLREFLTGYGRLFDRTGAPLHQGRSLTYRFASAAPLWLGALVDATPYSPGTTRRLASGVLRHFLDRGAARDGLLSLGWYGPDAATVQPYSGSASPYWAAKGFVGLLLPERHEVWTARESAGPAEQADADPALGLPGPGLLVHAGHGVARLVNHGADHQPAVPAAALDADDPLYARLAYSTLTGPTRCGDPADNHIGLVLAGRVTERGRIEPLGAGPGWAASAHSPTLDGHPVPDTRIVSVSVVRGPYEVRVHHVLAPTGTAVRASGWAPAAAAGARLRSAVEGLGARVDTASVRSTLTGAHGWERAAVHAAAHGTAFGEQAELAVLEGTVATGPLVTVLSLTWADTALVPAPRVTVTASDADVWWADGGVSRVRRTGADGCSVTHEPA